MDTPPSYSPEGHMGAMTETITASQSYDGTRRLDDQLVASAAGLENIEHAIADITEHSHALLHPITPLSERMVDQALEAHARRIMRATDEQQLALEHHIPFQTLQFPLIQTDGPAPDMGAQNSNVIQQFAPRLQMLIVALRRIRIFTDDISLHREGLRRDMMRQAPYILINIPRIGRGILVCSQVGEVTFVVGGTYIPGTDKDQIVAGGGRRIEHRNDEDWINEILGALQDPSLGTPPPAPPPITGSMDQPGYYTQQNVLLDLTAFTVANGLSHFSELTTGSGTTGARATCANGEEISLRQYIARASAAFGYSPQVKDAGHHKETLDDLKAIAGYSAPDIHTAMDADYFANPTNIREDLISFSLAAELPSVLRLSIDKEVLQKEAECMNGETMSLRAYLRRADVAYGNVVSTHHSPGGNDILQQLLHVIGLVPMDAEYFSHRTWIRSDLDGFADVAKVEFGRHLRPGNEHLSTRSACRNGEEMTLRYYIRQAADILELVTDEQQSDSRYEDKLKALQKQAGFLELDAEYFANTTLVREDLIAFARKAELETFMRLTTGNTVEATCMDGRNYTFLRYLSRAAVALNLATELGMGSRKAGTALGILRQRVGFVPQDAAYFRNAAYVYQDLTAYAAAVPVDSYEQLTTTYRTKEARCSNGEIMPLGTYLNHAGTELKLRDANTSGSGQQSAILKHLKGTAAQAA